MVGIGQLIIGRFKHAHPKGQIMTFEHVMLNLKESVVIWFTSLLFTGPNHVTKSTAWVTKTPTTVCCSVLFVLIRF